MKWWLQKLGAAIFLLAMVGFAGYLVWRREQPAPDAASAPAPKLATEARAEKVADLHPALYYETRAGGIVRCVLCPNRCVLADGQLGICRARKNVGGKLYSLVYGKIAALHVDPIEKKPFFHVLPGSKSFSLATPGCNMRCLFCQNWEISQAFPWEVPTRYMSPEEIVEGALKSGSQSIAFTYTEPIIFYEYMLDVAKLAQQKKIKTVVVSNGYINPEPLKELLKYVDAYKVDLKAFNDAFYADLTGGDRESVLNSLKVIRESGVWLEIVTLLIPGRNDSEQEIRALARWVKENLGPDVPLHFSRFHPQYKLQNVPPTPPETIIRAWNIAREEGLRYVYTGNVRYPPGETTFCPETGEPVIERQAYFVVRNRLNKGVCPSGYKMPGVWE
jgi:pyruvate formate lyase activating enzyme